MDSLIATLKSNIEGLSAEEAEERLSKLGPNTLEAKKCSTPLGLFLGQLKSPLILILIFTSILSVFLQEWVDAVIIISIVLVSAVLTSIQEYRANNATSHCQS